MKQANVLIILFLLSIDCFVVVLEKGAVMPYLSWKKIMKYSGLFAVVSLVMIVLGYMGGEFLTFDYFQQVNGMVLALLFAFIGSRVFF